jgi:very-short-patch-repair endonuclease
VGELGAIDLVVEDHIALELDGRAFHESTFERDRRKDLQITREGRHALRVSTSMLYREWHSVEAAIEAALHARLGPVAGNSGKPTPRPRGRKVSPGKGGEFA